VNETSPPSSGEMIQPEEIRPILDQFTESNPALIIPKPKIAPTIACVVETGSYMLKDSGCKESRKHAIS